ncbi:MAG TPA: hypothetical protein PKW23_07210 [Dictyoglomaceae bacterium]|nr:hypothetical protein [Dictyoglomaceae bacterium]HPP16568.1 hypothetical protein [Dictyoglomaceae bacterium]
MVSYILWLFTCSFTIVLLLYARSFYLKMMILFVNDFNTINILDKVLFIILSFVALGVIVFSDVYYKRDKKNFWRRFSLVTGIQLLVFFVFQYLPTIIIGAYMNWTEVLAGILELLIAGILIALSLKDKKHNNVVTQ